MSYWTAEYSAKQDCFHVDMLERVLTMNQENALKKNSNDFIILGIFDDVDEADKFCTRFRHSQQRQGKGAPACRMKKSLNF